MADRSVSVPMTLSGLEQRDAIEGSNFFRRICIITLVSFDLYDQSWGTVTRGTEAFQGSATPQFWDTLPKPKRFDLERPNLIW